ncbi:MAG: mechanosensitive ion channel domain-containing protein [Bacteroidota bacterium]
MDLFKILTDLLSQFAQAIPSILGAILIFLVGWMISKAVARVILRVLKKVGIDKLADKLNEIELVSKTNFEIRPSAFLSKLVYYLLLLIFTVAATDILGVAAVSQLMSDLIQYVPQLLSALILLVIGILIADFIKGIVQTTCKSLGIPSGNIIASFVFWFIFLTVLVSAMSQAAIDTTFIKSNLTVLIGGVVLAFALGYGFASKDMMANFLASFYSKNKFRIGDLISIEGIKGEIIEMDSTSLILSNAEGGRVIIPLHKLTSETVEIFDSK